MHRPSLLIVILAGLVTACSSGQTALRHGQFDLAVQRASFRLNQNPGLSKRGHRLAGLVLKEAFERAYRQHQTTIQRLSAADKPRPGEPGPFRWEAVHAEYAKLQTLTDNAARCRSCADWLSAYPTSYADRQNEVRQLAAADRYELAEEAFAYREENRLAARDAYTNYKKALDWVPDYRQARGKAADAFPFAILRVVVEPLGPTNEISSSDNAELEKLIFNELRQNDIPAPLVQLYPPTETAGDGYLIHEVVQMQVTDYDSYDENRSSSTTTVYSNQAYKVGEKKINDSTTVDIMEKVSGKLTTYRLEISAELALRLRALDTQTGRERWHDTVWETRSWVTEWQSFSGDNRALNGSSLLSANPFPPSRWELYRSMRDELASDVARRLRSRYAREEP